ncbi:ParB/RepB/Spo0J family partition protein [Paenibacillus alba]|uniref:ParB/RepB/Spo0J family partition protein n=1 Tax=Paenibacillus alba TaxID=1197127 RepID=UPI001562F6A4|nr:ParB/RepB/Spo0J family partition protein [Paenibacillus alba]NQX68980.1 ParB/RepB/Spo0J family partition protein [Paenibacillus alba]
MNIIEIPIALIDEDTDQPRYQFDEEALQELMKSIEEIGLLSPIKVRTTADNRYKIIYGNRRYKASKMLGKPTMSCIVSSVTDELEIYLEQIAENLTREGFSPIEEAEAFHKLMNDSKFSSSIKYLSSKLGKPESYIKNKCDLLKFGNAVKKLIVSGTEIRKDKLTEDQLLPLKDLAIEHRDPLALIVARDELPVSDVKKIAKMFKDKEISESTKGKLLYKSGPDLVETWSNFQNNRAERAKPTAAKAPSKAQKADVNASAMVAATAELAVTEPAAVVNMTAVSPIQSKLHQLLSALPTTPLELQDEGLDIEGNDQTKFLADVATLVEQLEKHLDAWKKVQELAASN